SQSRPGALIDNASEYQSAMAPLQLPLSKAAVVEESSREELLCRLSTRRMLLISSGHAEILE
ncbi:hypothetical protein, partial [Enterobacter hormaechei]|uniref:hypothetical protein n=1 Tax=Enterobacter hormaechei TaxID=158836 RepID=UPI001C3E9399